MKSSGDRDEEKNIKYRQLGLFSVIIAEVVGTPCVLGGLIYWLLRGKSGQNTGAAMAAVVGLVIGFYRVNQIGKP